MWFFEEAFDEDLPAPARIFDFSEALPQGISVSRAVPALGRDETGHWVSYGAHTLRPWHNPVSRDGPYALIEPERTQLLYRTRQPSLTGVQSVVTYDAAIQTPFGLGATALSPNATLSTHGWNLYFGNIGHGAGLADNATVSLQAVLKPSAGFTDITFSLQNKTAIYSTVRVSLQGLGSVVSVDGVISAAVERDTDGFYAISIVNNYGAGATQPSFLAGFHDQTGSRTFSGTAVPAFYLAYIGAELGTEATSPIVNTTTSTLVRAADIVMGTVDWIAPGGKTFGINYIPLSRTSSSILNLTGTTDGIDLRNTPATVSYSVLAAGSVSATITAAAPAPGIARTVILTADVNNFILAQDAAVIGTDTLGASPGGLTSLRLGDLVSGGGGGPVLIRMLKYWSTAISPEAAISFTYDLFQEIEAPVLPTVSVQPTMTIISTNNLVSLMVLVAGSTAGVTVNYRTMDETAVSGVDYIGSAGSLVIQPGETSGLIEIGLMTRGPIQDKTFRIVITSAFSANIAPNGGTCTVLLLRDIPDGIASTAIVLGATLPDTLSLKRSSPAWTRNTTGVWTQVSANAYRYHYVQPAAAGLLIEPGATEQRLFDSVDPGFSATAGTKTVVTTGDTPTGVRVLQFRETTVTAEHRLRVTLTNSNSVFPAGEFTVSILIRPQNRPYIRLIVRGVDNILAIIRMNLSGAGTLSGDNSSVLSTIERDPFRTDWYRVSLNRPQAASNGVAAEISLNTETLEGSEVLTGLTSNGFDLCHIQLEPGSGMSSPILVAGASAKTVRAADILKASGSWYRRQTYSLGVQFRRLRDMPSVQRLWMAKDAADEINGVSLTAGLISMDTPATAARVSLESVGTGVEISWTVPNPQVDGPFPSLALIDGVIQPLTAYAISGTILIFSEPPPQNSMIDLRSFGGSAMAAEQGIGTGSQTAWAIPSIDSEIVTVLASIDGVFQATSGYSVSGQTITFSEAVPVGALVDLRSVGAAIKEIETTGTGSQTVWILPTSVNITRQPFLVSVDGVIQPISSYVVSVNQLSFTQAPPVGSLIDIRMWTLGESLSTSDFSYEFSYEF